MNYETALTELLVRRAQPGSERVLDWLVYATPLPQLPRLDVVCADHRADPSFDSAGPH